MYINTNMVCIMRVSIQCIALGTMPIITRIILCMALTPILIVTCIILCILLMSIISSKQTAFHSLNLNQSNFH